MLVAVHSPEYVDAVRSMSENGGGAFDQENVVSQGSYSAAAHASGAACAMVEALMAGAAPVAFCATRPPDTTRAWTRRPDSACSTMSPWRVVMRWIRWAHDACSSSTGTCTTAMEPTTSSAPQTPCCSPASTSLGSSPGTGPLADEGTRAGEGYSINLPVEKGSYEDAWFSMLEYVVIPAAEEFQPDLVLISAGYDAHHDDDQGGCELDASSFAEMARYVRGLGERTGAPVGAVLEGGYALDALAASVCATMEALAGDQPADSTAPDFFTARAASHIGFHWRL